MNGTAYSNFDNQEHVLKLGETFEKQPKSAFHTVRCKWSLLIYTTTLTSKLKRVSLFADKSKKLATNATFHEAKKNTGTVLVSY